MADQELDQRSRAYWQHLASEARRSTQNLSLQQVQQVAPRNNQENTETVTPRLRLTP